MHAKTHSKYSTGSFVLNSLPDNKILALSKLKADGNFNLAQMVQFFCERVQNNSGKGEKAGYQHILFYPRHFQEASSPGLLKPVMFW